MNILQLLTHHELSMMIKMMKCQSQHKRRVLKSERRTRQQKSYGHLYTITTFSHANPHDSRMKHTSSSHGLRYKPESQGRELKHLEMSPFCFFKRGWPTCVEEMRKTVDDEKWRRTILLRTSFVQDARRFQRNNTCDTGNTDELRRSCYSDRWKSASTHRCKSQKSLPCNGETQTETHICEEIMIMFAYPTGTRVERPDMQTPRQRKDSVQILSLVMWIPTLLSIVGVNKLRFMSLSYCNPLSFIRTFTRDTLGYTRISRPSTAFATQPILIPHHSRCDPTREATASRVYPEKSNLRFLSWTARQTPCSLLPNFETF